MPRKKILSKKSYPDSLHGRSNDTEYIIEKIVRIKYRFDKISKERKRLYLIKWEGWPEADNTWEPIENLRGAQETIVKYWKTVSQKTKKRKSKGIISSPTKSDSNNENETRRRLSESNSPCDFKETTWSPSKGSPESNYSYDSCSESSSDKEEENDSNLLESVLQTINVSNIIPVGKVPDKIFGVTHKFGSTAFLVQWSGEMTIHVIHSEPFQTAFPDLVADWISSNVHTTVN